MASATDLGVWIGGIDWRRITNAGIARQRRRRAVEVEFAEIRVRFVQTLMDIAAVIRGCAVLVVALAGVVAAIGRSARGKYALVRVGVAQIVGAKIVVVAIGIAVAAVEFGCVCAKYANMVDAALGGAEQVVLAFTV